MLSVGLVADIAHRILEAREHVEKHTHLFGLVLAVLMELALLIHQVGELHHRFGGGAKTEA